MAPSQWGNFEFCRIQRRLPLSFSPTSGFLPPGKRTREQRHHSLPYCCSQRDGTRRLKGQHHRESQLQATTVFGSEASQANATRTSRPASRCETDFIDPLVDQRRHQYEFNAAGQGVLVWDRTLDRPLLGFCGLLMHANQIGPG